MSLSSFDSCLVMKCACRAFIAFSSLWLLIVRDNEAVENTTIASTPAGHSSTNVSISEMNVTVAAGQQLPRTTPRPTTRTSTKRKSGKHVHVTPASPKRKWLSQVFDQAKLAFDVPANASEKCRRDYDLFKAHLNNQTVWAVRS